MTAPASSPWLTSFGRRKGRSFRGAQKAFVSTLLEHYAVTLPENPEEHVHLSSLFGHVPEKLWLEIGFGGGEHLASQAENHPDIDFIGCEPFMDGVSHLLKHIETAKLTNVRLWKEDARFLVKALPDHSLDRVFILFPDPWPKKKHHKRRLIAGPLLDLLAAKMQAGGELRIATDHQDYARWILIQVLNHPAFEWTARSQQDWKTPPEDWVPTRYQQKAEAQGIKASFFRFMRKKI